MSQKKNLKIAFITENFPVLSETFVLFKIRAFEKRGHEVWVFTQNVKRNQKIMHEHFRQIDLETRVIKLPVFDRVRLKDIYRGLARVIFFSPLRVAGLGFRILFDPGAQGRRLRRFNLALPLLVERFDIIHAQFGNCGARYYSVQESLGVPMVVSFRGNDILLPKKELLPEYKPMFDKVARLLPGCDHIKKKAVELGGPPDKMEKIFTEKDLEIFSYFDRRDRKKKPPVILTVARLYWRKGYIYSLEAMRILKQGNIDFEYWIVGEGESREEIELAVKDLGLSDNVKFFGGKASREMNEMMHEADIFLMTSVLEGQGGVVVEAQATGLPVVATRVGGIPECVDDNKTGILVDSRDSKAIAEKIQYLIENPELRWEMGEKGRKFAEENFDQEKIIERLIGIYRDVINDFQGKSLDQKEKGGNAQ
jgi:colanic acid/amylovoran biosynthesis glycosyltransferase